MRSQLTRSVFLRLLSNEPLIFHCPKQYIRFRPRHAAPLLRLPSKRSLFGFSSKQPKEPRDPQLAPGLSKMLDLNMMDKIRARPPPPEELVQAWKQFFTYKASKREALNNIQAQHAVRTLKYLQQHDAEVSGVGLETADLKFALMAATRMPQDGRETHNELARLLYAELSRREGSGFERSSAPLLHFVSVLADTGDSSAARDIASKYSVTSTEDGESELPKDFKPTRRRLWNMVKSGFARENNEVELLRTIEMAKAAGCSPGVSTQEVMTTFYASRDDVPNTKLWYNKSSTALRHLPSAKTMLAILRLSIRTEELEFCKAVFREVLDRNPSKPVWDVLFQWVAGTLGKGVEDVERMIDAMIRCNPDNRDQRPDVQTMNGLVELAMSLNDSYLAERYIVLMGKYDIRPNAQTFLLQMDYRISAGDLAGAQAAYEALQAEEVLDDCDLPAINRYIRALCTPRTKYYDRIVAICSDLEERKARLEADTVSSLSMMYLSRGELNDVLDTLQVNAFHYTLAERASIIDTFVAFCLDRHHGTAEAWEAYEIFRHVFQETTISTRTQLMNEFFARKRSDMACYVFGHMRQHPRQEVRPVLETYIHCFRGIAQCEDKDSLDMVHNMFKMDSSIEPNTKLYNSLMMAYTECDDRERALDFWDDITNSREGPSYESLELVFKACQGMPFGDRTARTVWGKMRRMEIEVTRGVFVAYVGALGGQAKIEEAEGMIENGEKEFGLKPDALTIGSLYNALPGQNRKDLLETWARDHYPEIWTELEKIGQKTMKEGHRMFDIKNLVPA